MKRRTKILNNKSYSKLDLKHSLESIQYMLEGKNIGSLELYIIEQGLDHSDIIELNMLGETDIGYDPDSERIR